MDKLETIVFDLGRVLFEFDLQPVHEFAVAQGSAHSSLADFALAINQSAYERGDISSGEFIARVQGQLSSELSPEIIASTWQNIFTPCDDMLALLERLSDQYKVLILSNTNELHWEFLCEKYDVQDLAHGSITSFEVGALKPLPEIYKAAVKAYSLSPQHTVFIDDILINVQGAKDCGWHGIHHRSYGETCRELLLLGVDAVNINQP